MNASTELWLWRVTDPVSRRQFTTRYPMTAASALDFDPNAERLPGTRQDAAPRSGAARKAVPVERRTTAPSPRQAGERQALPWAPTTSWG